MIVRVTGGQVATASGVVEAVDIRVERERIVDLSPPTGGRVAVTIDLDGGWLLPGFVDTQVNGGGGVLFNDRLDIDAIAAIGAAHARYGTTAFMPTLISDTPDRIAAALDAVDGAIAAGVPGVVGVHIEGPFISEAKRGIHDAERIRRLDPDMLDLLARLRRGRVLLTLAPEQCAADDVRLLSSHGVIVSAGHSNSDYATAMAAIEAGLTGFTHLFNAMSPLHHRNPGAVGAAFDSDAYCGLIVDDVHLHPAIVRLAVRAKGAGRIMLVTDAMPSVGTDADDFMLQGKHILVRDGVCLFEDGTLAGTNLDMASALRNTISATGLAVDEVAQMASGTPARFLSIEADHGALAPGRRADWVRLDADLMPTGTWIGGIGREGALAAA